MAFKDIEKVMYDGRIKLDYKDSSHRYYIRERENFELPPENPKAWGKAHRPKGVTTILDSTLEKKGLMTWPLGLAIRELFGFYDFTNEKGERMTGFSEEKIVLEDGKIKKTGKLVGTLWNEDSSGIIAYNRETILPLVKSANGAWQRKQKKGADIGSVVHDAIEHFIKNEDYDIAENYNWAIKNSEFDSEEAEKLAWAEAPVEIEQATQAFLQFKKWWLETQPVLYGAEDILYSEKYDLPGTYDGDLGIKREHHPFPMMWDKAEIRVTADWKTSNASASEAAAAPEGVYYSYFIQLALYELMRREMGLPPADDLLTVSARKDGGFSLVYASECGLTVEDCISWAKCVITCHNFMVKAKKGLLAHGEAAIAPKVNEAKEAF